MTFKELEALMVKHGAVIRAITENERIIVEKRHADQFPNAKIKFLPEFNREMLVEVKPCKHGGQFVLECIKHSGATVKFSGNRSASAPQIMVRTKDGRLYHAPYSTWRKQDEQIKS